MIELFERLRLPGPGTQSEEPKQLRLDPMRSELDRARVVAFQRLTVCQVDTGRGTLPVVCGAPNVAPGMLARDRV